MINILIPVAGMASRFLEKGFTAPKPLIMVKNKHMIDWAMDSLDYTNCRLIFLVRKDHVNSYSIDRILREKFENEEDNVKVDIIVVDKITQGTLCTCLLAEHLINNNDPLYIYTPDITFSPVFKPCEKFLRDGFLLCFKANNPAHSYAVLDDFGFVSQTAEKEVLSNNACVGIYGFKTGKMFIKYARRMIENDIVTNGEFYICPIYNLMVEDGLKTTIEMATKVHILGTPEDLNFFTSNVLRVFGEKPIALCSDHSGFKLKEFIKHLMDKSQNIPYIDFGTYVEFDCDHYDFLYPAIIEIKNGNCDFGMAFCNTGQAFNIAANKIKGIRSALIIDDYYARYAIEHNCANFFCLPQSRLLYNPDEVIGIINALKNASHDGGRHTTRLRKIEDV